MTCARLTAALVAALAIAVPAGSALAARSGPQGLHAFTLRTNEPVVHTFSRTPSFAWSPVRGALDLPVRARNQQGLLGQRSDLVDQRTQEPRGLGPDLAALDDGQAVLTVRTRSRRYAQGLDCLERAVRLQHALVGCPGADHPGLPGPPPLDTVPGANAYMVWLVDAGKWFTTAPTWRTSASTTLPPGPGLAASFIGASGPCAGCMARPRTACLRSRTAPGARSMRTTTLRSRPGR